MRESVAEKPWCDMYEPAAQKARRLLNERASDVDGEADKWVAKIMHANPPSTFLEKMRYDPTRGKVVCELWSWWDEKAPDAVVREQIEIGIQKALGHRWWCIADCRMCYVIAREERL